MAEANIFNDPKFPHFKDVLDSHMKALKATGNYQLRKAQPMTETLEDLLGKRGYWEWTHHKLNWIQWYSIMASVLY